MAKIANVALTNTFDTWRVQSNKAFDRLSQFSNINSALYANTVTANTSFVSKSTSLLTGAATLGSTLRYGGVTLSNTATGTGNMVLATSPTITTATITDFIETAPTAVNSSTAQTISLTNGTVLRYTLTGNCTFTMPTATAGKSFMVMLTQDGTGSRTATFTGAKFPGGVAPTITTTASTGFDIISFVSNGTSWYGNAAQAFA